MLPQDVGGEPRRQAVRLRDTAEAEPVDQGGQPFGFEGEVEARAQGAERVGLGEAAPRDGPGAFVHASRLGGEVRPGPGGDGEGEPDLGLGGAGLVERQELGQQPDGRLEPVPRVPAKISAARPAMRVVTRSARTRIAKTIISSCVAK